MPPTREAPDDRVARPETRSPQTARGGALATRVEGNGVHVAIATSDERGGGARERVPRDTPGGRSDLRLDVHGRVLYVWEHPRVPTPTQRQTMYDCWYE